MSFDCVYDTHSIEFVFRLSTLITYSSSENFSHANGQLRTRRRKCNRSLSRARGFQSHLESAKRRSPKPQQKLPASGL